MQDIPSTIGYPKHITGVVLHAEKASHGAKRDDYIMSLKII
jgi:hypothetical protein